jgi:branched-chain amino acid transport system substrate-binding protein
MLGYNAAETLVMALEAAGPDLTQESFQKGMESVDYYSDLLDTQLTYGPGDHQGANEITISIVEDGQWKLLARE